MIIKNTQKRLVQIIGFLILLFVFHLTVSSSIYTVAKKSDRSQKTAIPINCCETENSENNTNGGTDDDNVQKEISDFEKIHFEKHRLHTVILIEKYTTHRTGLLRNLPSDIFLPPPEI